MKNIIITGTSRGIGLEMVKLFSRQGNRVLAISRSPRPVEELELENVQAVPCDITDDSELQQVEDYVKNEWEKVDILINNAGSLLNKLFLKSTVDEFRSVYDTNVFGVVGLLQKILPYMEKGGHVVNISSMGGVQGSTKFPGLSAYSSSKAALIGLTELLAEEYKENGPAFNVLALGAVQTEMLEEAFPGYRAPLSAAEMAEYIVNFSITGQKYFNGKLLEVSSSTP